MQRSNNCKSTFLKWTVLTFLATPLAAQAQTTAFNFQGRLSNLGLPVNGYHDLRFSVYGSLAGADVISGPITVSPVAVKNGAFHCRLDFGEQVFDGTGRWLDISVRPTGTSTFTNLSPRVELTSAPYAVQAKRATVAATVENGAAVKSLNNLKDNVTLAAGANVSITPSGNSLVIGSTTGGGGGWSTLNNNTYFTNGNVGIGTTIPTSKVEIVGAQNALKINGYQPVMTLLDSASFIDTALQSVSGSLNLFSGQYLDGISPSGFLQLNDNGNVGIGVANPVSKLDVRGALTLETGGNATLYTGTAGTEQNRYLNLINSPSAPSASGLKAGGVLVADSYSYANPGKNDLVVKGSVTAGGDAIQSRDKGGWIKAMAKVNADGTIARQYSGVGGSITVQNASGGNFFIYQITFPFQINDRYITVTPFGNNNILGPISAVVYEVNANTVEVDMFGYELVGDDWFYHIRNEFFICVY